MQPSAVTPTAIQPQSLWSTSLWLLLTTLGLLMLAEGFRTAPCWVLPLLVVALSYPLWRAGRERFLFSRRLLLTGATFEDCQVRRRLWQARIGGALQVVPALLLALLLLALSARLTALHWTILVVDALVLAVIYRFLHRRAASQVRPEVLGIFVRGWPLRLINLGLLTLAFFVLSFFVLGAPDLRQSSWEGVAEQAWLAGGQTVACEWAGWLVGGLGAIDQLSWALAQHSIPRLPVSEWRLLAWMLFLLQLGLLPLIFTRLLLGVLTLVESRALRAESIIGESALAKSFILTLLVLAMLFLYGALQLRDLDLHAFEWPADVDARTESALNAIDPCRGQDETHAPLQAALGTRIAADQAALAEAVERRIASEVDGLFAPVESAVDDYLDWYFTVVGEYERLAALVAGDFHQHLAAQLETHLFEATEFHAGLNALDTALMEDALTRLSALSQEVKDRLAAQIRANPCMRGMLETEQLAGLERDLWRVGAAGTSGVAAGVTTTLMSQKVVAAVVAKVGAKKSAQAAAAMAVKVAAKKGGGVLAASLGGAALCAPAGPLAIVCGATAGVVTWVAIDKAVIEIDEAVSREDMRAEILDVLAEEKDALKASLRQRHQSLIAAWGQDIQTTLDGVFIPARDGW